MEWISVKERLPNDSMPVLVFTERPNTRKKHSLWMRKVDRIKIDNYVTDHALGAGWNSIDNVTHWQPLPEPPTDFS